MPEQPKEENVADLIEEAQRAVVPDIVAELRRTAPKMLLEQRRDRIGFERRLRKRWAESLDTFEIILTIARETVDNFWTTYHVDALERQDFELEALHRIAVRACRVADEVLCLLRGGFADGAHARWRTLHELACVSLFIGSAGGDTAERYLAFQVVEQYKAAYNLQEWTQDIPEESASAERVTLFRRERERLYERFGREFGEEHGWALEGMRRLVSGFKGTRVRFDDIERAAGNRILRPCYRMSCDQVHAGPTGAAFSLALITPYPVYLTGASNSGLDRAGMAACLSLVQIVSIFLSQRTDEEALLAPMVLNAFVDQAFEAFSAIQAQIELEDEEIRESERPD